VRPADGGGPGAPGAPGARALRALRRALLDWYARNRRALPWRDDPDPYRVLVSEIMLQQTTVEAVRPRFEAFLSRFPTVGALAAASEEEVLAAWSGLGYYQRARNLRDAAIRIAREHGGAIPSSAEALSRLPGVGRYTAGAVASIAFGRPEPILDGNVARLLARLFVVGGDPRAAATKARLWDLAAALVHRDDPSSLNQALMEMGALVCRPRDPDCARCPLEDACGARRAGVVALYPQAAARARPTGVLVAAAVARDGRGRLLLARRAGKGALRGMWELPSAEVRPSDAPAEVARRLREETGLSFRLGPVVASARHSVMNRRIVLRAYRASLRAARGRETAWVAADAIARYPHSSLLEKVLARLAAT
jgi:A/G-specific adenine glycosylase